MEIKATIVFHKITEAVRKGFSVIALEGGSRSSKTWSTLQHLIFNEALSGNTKRITICREKLTWVKTTVLLDFQEIIEKYDIECTPAINPNRQDQIYYINGCEIGFFGLDDPKKLHGRKQCIAWMNEAMESKLSAFDQLEMRTDKYIILDYNPYDDDHWIFSKVLNRDDCKWIHSTQLHNPFLPEKIRRKILSYDPNNPENVRQQTCDKYMWDVYGLGKRARLKGVVFENWKEINSVPEEAKLICRGQDFGYSNDPAALIDIYLYNNEIILDERFYEVGLVNIKNPKIDSIQLRYEQLNIDKSTEIFADSAEPKSIEELRVAGWNILPAKKGQDSIKSGIDTMKSYTINITSRSINLITEFRKYKWMEDRDGKALNKPVDAFNHGIDGSRYGISMKLSKASMNNDFICVSV